MAWNLLCRQGLPQTHRYLLASASRVLELKASATMTDSWSYFPQGVYSSNRRYPGHWLSQHTYSSNSFTDLSKYWFLAHPKLKTCKTRNFITLPQRKIPKTWLSCRKWHFFLFSEVESCESSLTHFPHFSHQVLVPLEPLLSVLFAWLLSHSHVLQWGVSLSPNSSSHISPSLCLGHSSQSPASS